MAWKFSLKKRKETESGLPAISKQKRIEKKEGCRRSRGEGWRHEK